MAKRITFLIAATAVLAGCGAKAAPPAPPPPPKPFRIVYPEGFTRVQMSERTKKVALIAQHERHHKVVISESGYLAASRSAVVPCFGKARWTNLEGFLFPATYDFLRKTTSKQLVAAQIKAFCRKWRKVDMSYARSKNLTNYDVLKIASMVEEEVARPVERKLVAAVIYNRLHLGMALAIDATLRYGLNIPPTESIHQSQLDNPTPYNTRLHQGLPPTPIGNPGLAAIEAAAHPSKLGYLYYARIPGTNRQAFFESPSAYDAFLASHGYGPHS